MTASITHDARFAEWLRDHVAIPHKLSRAYTFDPADGADLHQEMLVQLWRSMPRFRDEAKASTWIYRVCLNTALTWQRNRRRREVHTGFVSGEPADAPSPEAGPIEARERAERLEALWNAVRALPAADRSLVVLALDGLSHREIGEVIGMTENHVGVALSRARRKLAATLKGIDDEF